jgi:hypothetical protein
MSLRRRFLLIFGCLLALSGCGGGGSESSTGRARVTVSWPVSRLVPFASSSIRVVVTQGNQGVGQAILARPPAGGTASATFERLPVGATSVSAVAYPGDGASGTPQAIGGSNVTVVKGQVATVDLTMASTIVSATMLPSSGSLAVGGGAVLTPSFLNAAGQGVIVSLATQQWSSANAAIATVDAGGRVTGVAAGTTTVQVRDTESGKTATAQITVTAGGGGGAGGAITFNSVNGHYYQAVSVPAGVDWPTAKAAAQVRSGYLATITSASENDFVFALVNDSRYWQNVNFSDSLGPWLGGFREGDTWKWLSGESWNYTNWDSTQPDNYSGIEDKLHYLARSWAVFEPKWNDLSASHTGLNSGKDPVAYVIEWDANPG